MRKFKTRLITFALLFIFLFSSLAFLGSKPTNATTSNNEESIYQSAQQTLSSLLDARKPEEDILDYLWIAFDLVRSGQKDTDYFLKELVDTIIKKEGVLSTRTGTYSNYAKTVLTLTAYGLDATNIGGYNLIEAVSKFASVIPQGVNGVIYALLALDSGNYEIKVPDNYPIAVTRDTYINAILSEQLDDGGWDYANKNADPDMTAMAIQALAPYYNSNDRVKSAIDKALLTLSNDLQQEDGGFQYADKRYAESSESTSMVILALTAMGIDPATDPRFVKSGGSPIDNLYSYAIEGKGFKHLANLSLDMLATDQAYRALTAYHRLVEGKTSIYDMSDVGFVGFIVWKNDDGTVLQTDTDVPYGTTPSYNSNTPTKKEDAQYTYIFNGWTPDITSVSGYAEYTAKYETNLRTYTVTWKNEDGAVLHTDAAVAYGTTPSYQGSTPIKKEDAQYTYAFSGWTPEIKSVTGNVTYTAKYDKTVRCYTITWTNDDGTVLETDRNIPYGTTPTYDGKTPMKAEDDLSTYAFKGWSPDIRAVTGNATYVAMYDRLYKDMFEDVQNPNVWYYDYVYMLTGTTNANGEKIMTGFNDGTFGPTKLLTRHDFAVIMRRLANVKEDDILLPDKSPFEDTIPGKYYYKSVVWANDNGIITGYGNGKFGVGVYITREQIVTILYRYLTEYLDQEISAEDHLSEFTDGNAHSSWAHDALIWATDVGIITGKDNNTRIDARGNATRAEIAKMVFTFITYSKEQELIR